MSGFPAKVNACGSSLNCVTALDQHLATEIQGFGATVNAAGITGQAATDAATVTG